MITEEESLDLTSKPIWMPLKRKMKKNIIKDSDFGPIASITTHPIRMMKSGFPTRTSTKVSTQLSELILPLPEMNAVNKITQLSPNLYKEVKWSECLPELKARITEETEDSTMKKEKLT